MFATDFEVV